jgi:diguanylate cyclase (GGDEF)-like protein
MTFLGGVVPIEHRLSDVLSEFARTLLTDFPIQGILDHLVKRIVDVLPVSAAGVTLISPTSKPHYIAASDESAMRFERLQTALGEGPCLVAYRTGEPVVSTDLSRDDRFPRFAASALEEGLAAVFTFPLRDGDRRLGALDLYRTAAGTLDDTAMAAAQTLADVTTAYLQNAQARVDLQSASEYALATSLHDPLTGLANRTLLVQRLEHALQRSRRSRRTVGVLFADLDRFKQVNDSFGHQVGDELLVAVAERVRGILRAGDTLARVSGDEFVVLCEELDDAAQGRRVARRIGYALREPFTLSTTELVVTASVGLAFAAADSLVPTQSSRSAGVGDRLQGAEQLLHEADIAMYQVKQDGGDGHGVLDQRALGMANDRLTLTRDLRGALAQGQLTPEYQPIVDTADDRVRGAEALLRWSHPTFGAIGPTSFIPLAEQAGLIVTIGRAVLEQACRDRSRWLGSGTHGDQPLGIAVNVSPHQLMAADFARTVKEILAETGTDPEVVTLEVTESALIQDRDRALVVLRSLRNLGARLALDDFGTGSSSLSHLRDFPVDVVKVDRAFVADLGHGSTSRHIVEAVVTLAHRLGMRAVAEGVETHEQHESVLALGCDLYQGYHFSPSVPAESFDRLVSRSGGPQTGTTDAARPNR